MNSFSSAERERNKVSLLRGCVGGVKRSRTRRSSGMLHSYHVSQSPRTVEAAASASLSPHRAQAQERPEAPKSLSESHLSQKPTLSLSLSLLPLYVSRCGDAILEIVLSSPYRPLIYRSQRASSLARKRLVVTPPCVSAAPSIMLNRNLFPLVFFSFFCGFLLRLLPFVFPSTLHHSSISTDQTVTFFLGLNFPMGLKNLDIDPTTAIFDTAKFLKTQPLMVKDCVDSHFVQSIK